ncbi:class I SAM-dependent methyltransferase [Sinomonas sp. ASV486]|uniref:class I SAM-dependent methyltransferase n=1 Tax=Sinomonas sp. ASV486 TaxID=3051170 RepID=UPI0027DC94E9|nr:class I SAM-dependent methyltransferase [Sinomonas sp. ASV486]MDQ4489975.1 class I SAM-dependent methyltransferase [Sinomonas sp. ASV486]
MNTEHKPGPSEFWDEFYSERQRVWSGKPNGALMREVSMISPGRAIDLGCGEGADAIWLAERGWTVTGVDISAVALGRAAAHAAEAGVADRVTWLVSDLAEWEPEQTYDLVTASFLHSPIEMPRERILLAGTRAVAPGGTLFVVGHTAFPPWARHAHDDAHMPSADELAASLGLRAADWELETSTSEGREATGPEGQTAVLTDAVLTARRLAS